MGIMMCSQSFIEIESHFPYYSLNPISHIGYLLIYIHTLLRLGFKFLTFLTYTTVTDNKNTFQLTNLASSLSLSLSQTLNLVPFSVAHFSPYICQSLAFLVMSEASRNTVTRSELTHIGPDYFGYYTREVVELLSQDDDILPSASQTSSLSGRKCGEVVGNNTIEYRNKFSGSLLTNSIGAGLSDFKKEGLKALLRQGISILSPEVDEMLDPVLAVCRLKSEVRRRKSPLSHTGATYDSDAGQVPHKKLKTTEAPKKSAALEGSKEFHLESNRGYEEDHREMDDLQFFLENDTLEVEDTVNKFSDELSAKLGYMEQQLGELLGAIMSTCSGI
ncbi:uncharacterized protein LOC115976546 isoform X4 [Quercus lobata]|uniref:uncharacterized protein LOC115976546 isoform X4 n=1 Tax=Quercus lobata TaxID=97700 RepID=UPI0012483A4D|nr:uncharacterized protein LOC115976546 isoform X4 [Quercus lobata]